MLKGHDLSPGILIGISDLWPDFSSVAASATYMIVIVFLQYRYNGDSFKTIPRYNDAILPVPWYIVISGYHCITTMAAS